MPESPRRPAKPRHGTVRRYKDGCRCDRCREANTTARRRERAKASGGTVPTTRKRVPTTRFVPTSTAPDDPTPPTDDETVRGTLARALATLDADDDMARFRKAHALRLASVLDDASKPHLWKGITSALAEVLAALVGNKPPQDGEADALAAFLGEIGRSRERRRGAAPVHDGEEP